MDIGKIPADILERIVLNPINRNKNRRDEIIIRPKTGEDCSAVDMKGELCIVSTDPITGADNNAGYIAVHINCNDIASIRWRACWNTYYSAFTKGKYRRTSRRNNEWSI